jgi:branched-chain amino acid aminotransferase
MKVWIDGRIVDAGEAKIPVLDHGLLYGDGIFEGIRVINRRVFRLPDHLRRLEISAKAIGLQLPVNRQQMQDIVLSTVRALGESEAYIRLLVTRGVGELGVDPTHCTTPSIICIVAQLKMFPAEKMLRGIDMITSSLRRPPADILDPRVKSLNYLNNVLAKREARLRGADDALILNTSGMVAEASGANIFLVSGQTLLTPPANDGALEGITRASVLECARELAIEYREATLARYDLLKADEVFLTGTGARVVPVATLDGQTLGDGDDRPVTHRIIDALNNYSRSHGIAF